VDYGFAVNKQITPFLCLTLQLALDCNGKSENLPNSRIGIVIADLVVYQHSFPKFPKKAFL